MPQTNLMSSSKKSGELLWIYRRFENRYFPILNLNDGVFFHHAYSLCYHEGMETPDFHGVNDKIRSKPYGDSHLYPQNQIWQIVGVVATRHSKGWRDFFCDLVIIENRRKQSENTSS